MLLVACVSVELVVREGRVVVVDLVEERAARFISCEPAAAGHCQSSGAEAPVARRKAAMATLGRMSVARSAEWSQGPYTAAERKIG